MFIGNEGILTFLHSFLHGYFIAKRALTVASSPSGIAWLALAATCTGSSASSTLRRTGTGVKTMQLTVLVQSCFEATTVLRIRRDTLARRQLPRVGMQASCKPKILAGEKLTRILARRLLQHSLASVLSQLDHRKSLYEV